MTTIQQQIEALPPSGGMVKLDDGLYELDRPVIITKSNVILQGTGTTVIRIADDRLQTDYGVFRINHCQNVTLRDLEIDGNRANNEFEGSIATIRTNAASRLLFDNLHIHDCMGDGIEVCDGSDVRVINSYLHHCRQHALHYNGVTDGFIVGCHLSDDGGSLIATAHGGIRRVIIAHNVLERPGRDAAAIQVSTNDTSPDMRHYCHVTNNILDLGEERALTIAENAVGILVACNQFITTCQYPMTIYPGADVSFKNNIGYADS